MLAAGVRVDLGIEDEDVDVAAQREHVVEPAEADVVRPAVTPDDPDALRDERVGERGESGGVGIVDAREGCAKRLDLRAPRSDRLLAVRHRRLKLRGEGVPDPPRELSQEDAGETADALELVAIHYETTEAAARQQLLQTEESFEEVKPELQLLSPEETADAGQAIERLASLVDQSASAQQVESAAKEARATVRRAARLR